MLAHQTLLITRDNSSMPHSSHTGICLVTSVHDAGCFGRIVFRSLHVVVNGKHTVFSVIIYRLCFPPELITLISIHVLVIAPLRGMLLVYKPDTRGRAAPSGGGGLINRNILSEGAISDLQPVAMWLTSKRGVWLLVTLLAAG